MRQIIVTILILTCLFSFSKKPKWIPEKEEYQIELINLGDLPLEIYSIKMSKGKYTETEDLSFTIDSAETVSIYLYASSCIDTLTVVSNSVPNDTQKVLFKYNKLKGQK